MNLRDEFYKSRANPAMSSCYLRFIRYLTNPVNMRAVKKIKWIPGSKNLAAVSIKQLFVVSPGP
ncbi:hypothetical protein QUF76_14040 [Desulfobacterales bacterium HSG16]|nr:hypothetical protein [Desulfobacterales bacterium HSG16]